MCSRNLLFFFFFFFFRCEKTNACGTSGNLYMYIHIPSFVGLLPFNHGVSDLRKIHPHRKSNSI